MDANMNMNDASNASNFPSSEPSKSAELVDDSMDVDESNVTYSGPYKVLKVPGRPNLIEGLEFDDNFEEEEAEMSSESDEEDEGEIPEVEGGATKEISAAILLDKSIGETEDDEDPDYVPAN